MTDADLLKRYLVHLTADQRSRYLLALKASQEASLDFDAAAVAQKLDPDDPSLNDQSAKMHDQLVASERAVLGDEFDSWQDAARGLNAQGTVRQLMQSTFQTDGAFTPVQADQLTQVVARHQLRNNRTDWEGVLAEAKGVLTSQQMDYFTVAVASLESRAEMNAIEQGRTTQPASSTH